MKSVKEIYHNMKNTTFSEVKEFLKPSYCELSVYEGTLWTGLGLGLLGTYAGLEYGLLGAFGPTLLAYEIFRAREAGLLGHEAKEEMKKCKEGRCEHRKKKNEK